MNGQRDIKLTADGDFELNENNDISLSEGNDLVQQKINIALKTSNPDWFYDMIGADLEDLIGMENTLETGNLGKKKIGDALTTHGFFAPGDIYIEVKPYNRSTMLFMLFVRVPELSDSQVYRITLDLGSGATIRRVA